MNYEIKSDHAVIRLSYEEAQALKNDVVLAQMAVAKDNKYNTTNSIDQLERILRVLTSPSNDVWDSQAFEYSEWLDQNGYLTPREDDEATHEELVSQFFSDTYDR